MRRLNFPAEILAVLGKELRVELRSRVALNAVGLFALAILIAVSYQIGPYTISPAERPFLLSALLWIILFFAASSGLPRVFVKEEDSQTAKTLRLASRPMAVFGGKLLFNLLLLMVMKALIVPLYCLLMGFEIAGVAGLILLMATGAFSLAAATTLVAAIISRSSGSNALFVVLTVPLVLPLLVVLIQGTRAAATDPLTAAVLPSLVPALSLGMATLLASAFLFPVVWHD